MASRNRVKTYVDKSYYHIYNRGVEKRVIFENKEDYSVFLNLIKRYLSIEPVKDNKGRQYTWLHEDIELIAFCLMPNHFHMFVYQDKRDAMTRLMRGVCSAYTTYFNKKYDRVGPLFQDRYKAVLLINEAHYIHISRYIHLNPVDYMEWEWSSLQYYLGSKNASWVTTGSVMEQFEFDTEKYLEFIKDYRKYKESLADIVDELAG